MYSVFTLYWSTFQKMHFRTCPCWVESVLLPECLFLHHNPHFLSIEGEKLLPVLAAFSSQNFPLRCKNLTYKWAVTAWLGRHNALASQNQTLTLCADDPGSFPGAIGPAAGSGDVALEEALRALVADHCVDVIVWPPPSHQMGIVHHWRGSTQHCRQRWITHTRVRYHILAIHLLKQVQIWHRDESSRAAVAPWWNSFSCILPLGGSVVSVAFYLTVLKVLTCFTFELNVHRREMQC